MSDKQTMTNLSKRLRFRNVCGITASLVFSGFLGLGGAALINEWHSQAIVLIGLSVAWLAFALTVGDRLMESHIEKHYSMEAK